MSTRISLEQPISFQGQWKQQSKVQNQNQVNSSINAIQPNSGQTQNSINSIMVNHGSNITHGSPQTPFNSGFPLVNPNQLNLAAGNEQNIQTQYGLSPMSKVIEKMNENKNIDKQLTIQQQMNNSNNINQQNSSLQNYMSSSQNTVSNTNNNNTPNTGNYQSNQNKNNSTNSISTSTIQLQTNIQNGKGNISTAGVGNNCNSLNNITQNQQNQIQIQGSHNSLNYLSNNKQNINSLVNIDTNSISEIQNNNTHKANSIQVINNSQIKINNIVIGELNDKVTDQEKQTQDQIDMKENKILQDKTPTTLGQQIYETLMAQSTQVQNPQNLQQQISNQQTHQLQQSSSQPQSNSNILTKYFSQNNPSSSTNSNNFINQQNYSSVQQDSQTKNQVEDINPNNKNENTYHQNQDNAQSSINSARFSAQSYLANINNSLSSSTQYQSSKLNNNVRNSGVRNHTLEKTDNVRSGNLNTKVQNNTQYNKGNGGFNSSSGASNTPQNNSNSTNNLLRKSLEYSQQSGLSGLNPPVNNQIQSTTINLYSSPQQTSQQGQNIQQMNLSKSANSKTTANCNLYSKEANSNEQKGVETRFIDYYNKNKSPRDQMQLINKANKEKSYNITEYEALNQQNQQQHQTVANNSSSQAKTPTSQNSQNQLNHQSSFTNLNTKTTDSQQNNPGYIALGIELSSRSLERKVFPSSNKNASQNNLASKYLNYNQGKSVSGLSQLQTDQSATQKNGRSGHHLSTANTSKNLKNSRSNTPTKNSSNSNFISPNPSFLGSTSAISGSNSKYQLGSNQRNQQQGSNKNQQGNSQYNQQSKVNPFQVDQSYQSHKNQSDQHKYSEQNSQISYTNSTDKLLQQQQQKLQTNNSQPNQSQTLSLSSKIVQIGNNSQQLDLAQKQSPRASQNLQSQSQKLNHLPQTISQSSITNQLFENNPNKSTSPKPKQSINDKFDNFSKERPKSQTINEPKTEKISSSHHIDMKTLASNYNPEAIQNFLENQNARIAANQQTISTLQSFGQIQDDKRSSSMNKQQQQASLPVSLNPSIQNFNSQNSQTVVTGSQNRYLISSEIETNNQLYQFGNNLQSKSKSPVNLQKDVPKPFDFSQLNNNKQQENQQKPLSSPAYPKFSYKPLTLNTEETNNSAGNTIYNTSSNSSKNKNAQSIQNKVQESINPQTQYQSVNFSSQVSQKQDINANQSSQQQQQSQQQQFSPIQTQMHQNQPRDSLNYGNNNFSQGSPQSQNLSSKSREKLSKKPIHSNVRQFSDKKNYSNINNKSPTSNNNNSYQQNPLQLSTTTSIVNDNSMTYFSSKRTDKFDQQLNSANLSASSPFTNKQVDEHSTPTQTSNFGEQGSKSNISLLNEHFYQTFSANIYKNSLSTPNTHHLDMVKVKEKMKKILESHAQKEKLLQNENQDLKNQIMALKQTINNQQSEITQLKSNKNESLSFQNNNTAQLQMSFQNLFNQEYSASKNQLSPKSIQAESLQVFQSPLEISFQQHQ